MSGGAPPFIHFGTLIWGLCPWEASYLHLKIVTCNQPELEHFLFTTTYLMNPNGSLFQTFCSHVVNLRISCWWIRWKPLFSHFNRRPPEPSPVSRAGEKPLEKILPPKNKKYLCLNAFECALPLKIFPRLESFRPLHYSDYETNGTQYPGNRT